MAAHWNRETYRQRRWELRQSIRLNEGAQLRDGYMGVNARHQLIADRQSLLLIDCGTAEVTYPNPRLRDALARNRRLVADRLHRERVARELPKVRELAREAGMSRLGQALAELSVTFGGKAAAEVVA